MTNQEIIDNLELYTVGRLKKSQVSITVEELQNLIDGIKSLGQPNVEGCKNCSVKHELDVNLKKWADAYERGVEYGRKCSTSDDCISRQAVLDKAYAYGNGLVPEGYCVDVEDIQALPPVIPIFPNSATNGDMILTVFDTATVYEIDKENDCITICIDNNFYQKFRYSW
jgi:hypothetical protein